MMEDTYENSYVEVLEILKHIPKDEYEKIPKQIIFFYEINKNKDYEYSYDVKNPKTMRKTDAIIINLYKDYVASDEERKRVEEILKLNTQKLELEKINKFDSNVIFKNNEEIDEEKNTPTDMIVAENEKWYTKIFKKIKNLFK